MDNEAAAALYAAYELRNIDIYEVELEPAATLANLDAEGWVLMRKPATGMKYIEVCEDFKCGGYENCPACNPGVTNGKN